MFLFIIILSSWGNIFLRSFINFSKCLIEHYWIGRIATAKTHNPSASGSVIDAAHIRWLLLRGPNSAEVSRTESLASHQHLECSQEPNWPLRELLLSLPLLLSIPSCCFVYHLLFTCRNFIAAILFVVVVSSFSFFSSKESARWGTFQMPSLGHLQLRAAY